jgi:predicted NBD/HSP70 family sugar kinase
MIEKASREQVRRQNRFVVLSTLRRHTTLARVDLGRLTGLSLAAVTSITADLKDRGLITEVEEQPNPDANTRGRPRTYLRLRDDVAHVVTVKLSVDRVSLALVDYTGHQHAEAKFMVESSDMGGEAFITLLAREIKALMKTEPLLARTVMEITVATQGIVGKRNGSIIWSPTIAERQVELTAKLSKTLGITCTLYNDTNMIAEALHRQDAEKYSGNFVVVYIDRGVGMGIFIKNALYRGETGAAAEYGHSPFTPDGAACRCGKKGCLEAYIADYALYREAQKLPKETSPSAMFYGPEYIQNLRARARIGDAQAQKVFTDAGFALGVSLARTISLLDPSRIVLTGKAMQAYDLFKHGMNKGLESSLLAPLLDAVNLEVLPWDEDFILQGLLIKALKHLDEALIH